MSSLASVSINDIKYSLLDVATQCSMRGLVQSMKWSAELANAVSTVDNSNTEVSNIMTSNDELFLTEYHKYCLGKAYFDSKEYMRSARCFKGSKSSICQFLYYYSRYLSIEKKKRYQMVEVLDENATEQKDWQELIDLKDELKRNEDSLDPYGFYLYGVVLKSLDLIKEAIENFECSIQMQPLHWGPWEELVSLCRDKQMLMEFKVQKHWMGEFFYAYGELELHMNEEAIARYHELSNVGFVNSTYVRSQIATCLYNLREFDASVEYFRELYTFDPDMLENMDVYSNILYIQDARSDLSYLAHRACEIDKYRPESCGVIGNYYSLRGDHEKAVLYFKQALRLNPKYVAAWTLLGHEYVELRNTSAAIESYRKATDVNSRDYRAWYGLGQTYELLKMPYYSLYYFKEAHKLRSTVVKLPSNNSCYINDFYINYGDPDTCCYINDFCINDGDPDTCCYINDFCINDGDPDTCLSQAVCGWFVRMMEFIEKLATSEPATVGHPNDARMLLALGDTYNNIENTNEAKKCYLRAVLLGDSEGLATVKLGKLHVRVGELDEAANLFTKYLKKVDNIVPFTEDLPHACLYLARYHKGMKNYQEAMIYARKAADFAESRDAAKTLIFEIGRLNISSK